MFIEVRPGGSLVRSVSLGCALQEIEIVRDRCVDWCAPCGSWCSVRVAGFGRVSWVYWGTSVSFGVAGFIGVRTGERLVRSGLLGSLLCALGFYVFVRDRWVPWGTPCE